MGKNLRILALATGVLVTETAALAQQVPYFRFMGFAPESGGAAAPTPAANTDPQTGLSVYVPCTTCYARIARPFSLQPSASGPVQGWGLDGGQVAPGTQADGATGLVSGTPTAVGSYGFVLAATHPSGRLVDAPAVTVVVQPPPTIAYSSSTGPAGRAVSLAPSLRYLSGPSRFALAAGSVPGGLTFDAATGTFSGNVTAGVLGIRVAVTDPDGSVATSDPFDVVATNPAGGSGSASMASATGRVNRPLAMQATATGLSGPTWALTAGQLPNGLTPTPDGRVSGTPTIPGHTGGLAMTASAGNGTAVTPNFTIDVIPPLALSPQADVTGPVGYDLLATQAGVQNAVGNLTYALGSSGSNVSSSIGTLCPGLGFDPGTGRLSGRPSQPCSVSLAYTVNDDGGTTQAADSATSAPFRLTATAATVTVGGVPSPVDVVEGSTVSLTGTTSLPSPTWTASGGPAWLAFAPSGAAYAASAVSPDVTAVQTWRVTLTATGGGASQSGYADVTVRPGTVTVGPGLARGGGTFTMALSTNIPSPGSWSSPAVTGDVTNVTVSGATLAGKAPANNGTTTVTRTVPATYVGPVPASGARATASGTGTLSVVPALSVASPGAQAGKVGVAMSVAAPAPNGQVGTITWGLTQNGADASQKIASTCQGLTFDATKGTISGTPTSTCSVSLAFTASDDGGGTQALAANATSAAFALSVTQGTITTPQAQSFSETTPVSISPTQSGVATPVTWSISSGVLPAGLTQNASTGVISGTVGGTPDSRGAQPAFVIRGTGPDGSYADSKPITVTVTPAMTVNTLTGLQVGQPILYANSALVSTNLSYDNNRSSTWQFRLDPSSGRLPLGLWLIQDNSYNDPVPETDQLYNRNPQVNGTPLQSGTFTVRVLAYDPVSKRQLVSDDIPLNIAPAPGDPIALLQDYRADNDVVFGYRISQNQGLRPVPTDPLAAQVPAGNTCGSACNGKRNLVVIPPYQANSSGIVGRFPADPFWQAQGISTALGGYNYVFYTSDGLAPGTYNPTVYVADNNTGGTGRVGVWQPTVKVFQSTITKYAPVSYYTRTPGATSGTSTFSGTLNPGDTLDVVHTAALPVVANDFMIQCNGSNAATGPATFRVDAQLPDGTWRTFYTRQGFACSGTNTPGGTIVPPDGVAALPGGPANAIVTSRWRITVLAGSLPMQRAYPTKAVTWYNPSTGQWE